MSKPYGLRAAGLFHYPASLSPKQNGSYSDLGVAKLYYFDSPIRAGKTSVPDTADPGDFASTIHRVGRRKLFKNIDGVWVALAI